MKPIHQASIAFANYGNFSQDHLAAYQKRKGIKARAIKRLQRFEYSEKDQLEQDLMLHLSSQEYQLIIHLGIAGGALFVEGIDWELAALAHKNTDVFSMIIDLDNKNTQQKVLTILAATRQRKDAWVPGRRRPDYPLRNTHQHRRGESMTWN